MSQATAPSLSADLPVPHTPHHCKLVLKLCALSLQVCGRCVCSDNAIRVVDAASMEMVQYVQACTLPLLLPPLPPIPPILWFRGRLTCCGAGNVPGEPCHILGPPRGPPALCRSIQWTPRGAAVLRLPPRQVLSGARGLHSTHAGRRGGREAGSMYLRNTGPSIKWLSDSVVQVVPQNVISRTDDQVQHTVSVCSTLSACAAHRKPMQHTAALGQHVQHTISLCRTPSAYAAHRQHVAHCQHVQHTQ